MTLDLHIGAHKTATTFIQQNLRKNAAVLEAAGTRFLSPREIRSLHEESWNDGDVKIIQSLADFDASSAEVALSDDRRLLISDENLMGPALAFYRANTNYPHVSDYLQMMQTILPCAPQNIYLCLRSYDEVFPALYFQFQRRDIFRNVDDEFRDQLIAKERRFPQIVSDVQNAFPTANVKIWLYEDFCKHPEKIVSMLAGSHIKLSKNARPRVTASADAYHAWVEVMNDPNVDAEFSDRFVRWYNKSEFKEKDGAQKFRDFFWRESDKATLRRQYRDDVIELKGQGFVLDLEGL